MATVEIEPMVTALEICNGEKFKKEVLSDISQDGERPEMCKQRWEEIAKGAVRLLEDWYSLDEHKREKLTGAILTIAMRMLIWVEYHVGTFQFSRDFCIKFLDLELFTSTGMINPLRVEIKMYQQELQQEFTNLQKFQLACFSCNYRVIRELFLQMSVAEKAVVFHEDDPTRINQPNIIKYWSYYVNEKLDMYRESMRNENPIMEDEHLIIVCAVTSGSAMAIKYCLDVIGSNESKTREDYAVYTRDVAVSIVWQKVLNELAYRDTDFPGDLIVFRNRRYNCSEESWVPDIFLADIFNSIIPMIDYSQQEIFWDKIVDDLFLRGHRRVTAVTYAEALNGLICWPHQEKFLWLLNSSWGSKVSTGVFSNLFLKIAQRIETRRGQLWYGEEGLYSYGRMLIEAWAKCPSLKKLEIFTKHRGNVAALFGTLFNLRSFTERDNPLIRLIINSVPTKMWYEYIGDILIEGWKLQRPFHQIFVDRIISCYCHSDPSEIRIYKGTFLRNSLTPFRIIDENNWDLADRFIIWLNLPNNIIRAWKIELMFADPLFDEIFTNLLSRRADDSKFTDNGGKRLVIERFMNWFLVDDFPSLLCFKLKMKRFRDVPDRPEADNIVLDLIDELESRRDLYLL